MQVRADGHVGEARDPLLGHDAEQGEDPRASLAESAHSGYDLGGDGADGEAAPPGMFVWILTASAGVSGLLFGYDTGVISSTLISLGTDLSNRPLTVLDKSLITSSTSLLALLASPLAGILSDSLGRKPVVLLAALLFTLGALWQSFTTTVWGMIGGRSVVGAAVGAASFVVPLYISELAPSAARGRLVTVQSLFITGGQVVAYLIGWAFSGMEGGWRWMVGLGALPAIIQGILLLRMPETPRWLVRAGKKERAKVILGKVYGGNNRTVESVLRAVEKEVLEEEEAIAARDDGEQAGKRMGRFGKMEETWKELVAVGGNRRALIIACMLQGFQQLCGFNSLMYFSATIFALVGFQSPTLTSLSIAFTNFLFTLVAFHSIDRIGRRRILLGSIPIMIVGLVLCSVAFNFIKLPEQPAETNASVARQLLGLSLRADEVKKTGTFWAFAILAAMVLYVAGYAVGLGCVPWQQSELFPLPVRSLGSALATATNWGSNFLVGLTFLPLMELLSPAGTFAVYAVICVGGYLSVWMIYPETAGLGLEEVGALLRDGWGVKHRGFRSARTE